METIVVYSSNKIFIDKNMKCLNLFVSNYNVDACIRRFNVYNEDLEKIIRNNFRKIYILDVSSDKISGLELAIKIREVDYQSIIILVNSDCEYNKDISNNRLMILDFICINDDYNNRLVDDMRIAMSILDNNVDKMFAFKYKRNVYRIPFSDITYIEKESNIKRCIIHTIDKKYYITDSLNSILSKLDNNFCRTHQSCIVNLNNIKRMKLGSSLIIFKNNDSTDMITSKMKKEIKNYIGVL